MSYLHEMMVPKCNHVIHESLQHSIYIHIYMTLELSCTLMFHDLMLKDIMGQTATQFNIYETGQ